MSAHHFRRISVRPFPTSTALGALAMFAGSLVPPLARAADDVPRFAWEEAEPHPLRLQDESGGGEGTVDRHPGWVRDLESKMWPGFLTGMEGFDDFVAPIGMFVYFEDPFIRSDIRLIYVYHDIPDGSEARGGEVNLVAAQLRLALTERWSLIAVKDGFSWVDTSITDEGEGWNDIMIGLKYAIYANPEEEEILSAGIRWEWTNGSGEAFQGGRSQEISPFISYAKGWDKWHFLATLSGRIATNRSAANSSVVWNMHLDYELTETFRPLVEFHGIHWITNADRLPLSVDYLDVGSFGSSRVAGRDFFSAGLGFRWQAADNVSIGLTYEFPLESPDENLQEQRVTFSTVISF